MMVARTDEVTVTNAIGIQDETVLVSQQYKQTIRLAHTHLQHSLARRRSDAYDEDRRGDVSFNHFVDNGAPTKNLNSTRSRDVHHVVILGPEAGLVLEGAQLHPVVVVEAAAIHAHARVPVLEIAETEVNVKRHFHVLSVGR